MDASVNMKMTPQDARDIRECVEEKATELRDDLRQGRVGQGQRTSVQNREARLRSLLTKM